MIALLAALVGESSYSSFARFAKHKYEFPSEFMEFKGGPQCYDSFSDLFSGLDSTLLVGLPEDQSAIIDRHAILPLIGDHRRPF